MITMLRKIYLLLSPAERKRSLLLLLQMMLSSTINIFGIALIFPFMSLVLDPNYLYKQKTFALIYKTLNFNTQHDFLIFLGIFIFIFIVVGNVVTIFNIWSISNFSLSRNYSFSKKLFTNYLQQPYAFFLDKNSTNLTKNILVEVNMIVQNILLSSIRVLDQSIYSILILFLLLFVNPWMSLFVLIGLGGVYAAIYFGIRKKLSSISRKTVSARTMLFKIVSEGFGGIKDIKLLKLEDNIVANYSGHAKVFAKQAASSNFIAQVPRYALETVAFGGVIIAIVCLLAINFNISGIVPILSLYVFAGYRLMPSLQQVFASTTAIKTNKGSLDNIFEDLARPSVKYEHNSQQLPFRKNLLLQNIIFGYSGSPKPVINGLSLEIKPNTTVAFVGHTGAGKSTIVDIMLGLLSPQTGNLILDDVILDDEKIKIWQNSLGYVPQNIYLTDDTISRNIAFGLADQEIDVDAVLQAAKIACLNEFIENELPNKYNTVIGERGIKLSGGQVQRIGIARALYRDPQVLVFDEATSALDNVTENVIIQAVKNLAHKKTIIMIAHRLSTVKECDKIFFMKNGTIVDIGTYVELLNRNRDFNKMAKKI